MFALCQRRAPSPHDQRTAKAWQAWSNGFSAVELLVVLAIAGILAAIAVPSFQSLMQANRISSEIGSLFNDLQFSRAEALRTGQFVSICTSSNGTTCNVTGGDWRNGWIVFADINGNRIMGAGDTILRVRQAFTNTDTFQSLPATTALSYNRNGMASGLNSSIVLTVKTTPVTAQLNRCLAVSVTGQVKSLTFPTCQ